MIAYLNADEIKASLEALVKHYIQESIKNGELPRDFVELLKHNFYAKYAFYDQHTESIEIGINEYIKAISPYPPLTVYSFSIHETQWITDSIRPGAFHMDFYGKLLSRNKGSNFREIIVI